MSLGQLSQMARTPGDRTDCKVTDVCKCAAVSLIRTSRIRVYETAVEPVGPAGSVRVAGSYPINEEHLQLVPCGCEDEVSLQKGGGR